MAQFFTPKSNKSKTLKQNTIATLRIDAHDHAGNGLCLSSKPITIVPEGLQGELCRVRYSKQTKKVNFAELVKVEEASELRSKAFCEYYGQCGGCSLQHTNAGHGLALKEKALTTFVSNKLGMSDTNDKNGLWHAPVLSDIDYKQRPKKTSYRRRIRLAIDARNKQKIKIGFRAANSQSVIDIKHCAIANDSINECLQVLRMHLPHLPSVHKIGHIVITEGLNQLQVAIFTPQKLCKKSLEKLEKLASSVAFNIVIEAKDGGSFSLPSSDGQPASPLFIEDMQNVPLRIDSKHFLQVNKAVNQAMIQRAKEWLALCAEDSVHDFFCGSGNFALSFANHVASIKAYEGVAEMVTVANANAQSMALTNIEFHTADLSSPEALQSLAFEQNSKVVLDPSREGALELCQFLATQKLGHILYVSCNPNSFVRDASYLLPRYRLSKISALDMFPFTKHLELMALFTLKV